MNINKVLFKNEVAANLKRIRKRCGYKSASEFAVAKGIAIQTYLNHESGKRGMSLLIILYYAYLFGVDYTAIIGDSQHLQTLFQEGSLF